MGLGKGAVYDISPPPHMPLPKNRNLFIPLVSDFDKLNTLEFPDFVNLENRAIYGHAFTVYFS